MKIVPFAFFAVMLALPADADSKYEVASPDGRNKVEVTCGSGGITFSVFRDGRLRMGPVSPDMTFNGRLSPRGAFSAPERASFRGTEKTAFYKKSTVDISCNRASFACSDGTVFEVALRDDAAAYRFSRSASTPRERVDAERSDIFFPGSVTETWLATEWSNRITKIDPFQNSWEHPHTKRAVSSIGVTNIVTLPIVARFDDGCVMCVSESDLKDYPGWNFRRREGEENILRGAFARFPDESTCTNDMTHIWIKGRKDFLVETSGKRTYPWRVFMFADAPEKLCENDAVWALAPRATEDFSWVKPGIAAWDWWNGWVLRGNLSFTPGMNTPTLKHYIDFASEMKLTYYVIDAGWTVDDDLSRPKPSVDIEEVCRHAAAKNVKLILWSGWGAFFPGGKDVREEMFRKYSRMGASGFKIDFIDRDDAIAEQFIVSTAELAAKYKLVILYHGMHKPTGLSRQYPNVLNYEGVFGLEQVKWSNMDFAFTDLSVFYCRMSAGPLDYTPGAMRNSTKKAYRVSYLTPESMTTRVHQMALYTMYEGPLQMMCDSPTMYRENMECARFISEVPTVWDETKGVSGDMENYAVVARRKGGEWWVGGIGRRQPIDVEISLDFLAPGRWKVDAFEDGPLASGADARDYRRRSFEVRSGEKIVLKMAGGGGWAARFTPCR